MMEHAVNHAYRALIDQRIHQLLVNRRWYRANLWAHWSDLRREDEVELRALLKIARAARKMAAAAPDAIDQYKAGRDRGMGYHDVQAWTEDAGYLVAPLDWHGELGA